MSLRIALVGSKGYVGRFFFDALRARSHVPLPIRRWEVPKLANCLRIFGADALINCAGYTGKPNVDACESSRMECLEANAVLPGKIARACEQVQIPWGHVSSGCIYTGRRADGRGFTEEDPPNFTFRQNNCSFYSGAKALGEELLSDAERCYIWRLRVPFSEFDSPRNYLSKLMTYEKLLDVENSLSYLPEFVDACLDCLQKKLPHGTYNLVNPGVVSTRDITRIIQRYKNKTFRFFDSEEEFLKTVEAPRSHCVLDCSKALLMGLELTHALNALDYSLSCWS